MGSTRVVWRIGAVKAIVMAFAGVTVGEWILGTATAIHAYSAGGAVLVGLVGFRFAPASLASLLTYQLVDRYPRQRILTTVALIRTVAATGVALCLWRKVPWGLPIALIWLDAAAGSAYRPAQAALLPALVSTPGELTAATGLASNAKSSSQVLGALLGSVLVTWLPIGLAIGAAPLVYIGAALATATIRTRRADTRRSQRTGEALRRARIGLTSLARDREASEIAAFAAVRSLVRGSWIALGVVASERLLGLGQPGFGYLMSAALAGAVLAIWITAKLVGRRHIASWFAGGLILCGLPVALIGAVGNGGLAIALMVVWGTGMALSDAAGQALLNRVVPAPQISWAIGVVESGKLLFEGAGALLAAAVLDALGIRGALVAAGVLVPAGVLLLLPAFPRIQRRSESRTEVLELLTGVPLLKPLHLEMLEAVAAQLRPLAVPAGTEVVTHQVRDDGGWYLVRSGQMEVVIEGYVVGRLGPGQGFGELALLRNVPRAATVRAATPATLLTIDRPAFLEAVAGGGLDASAFPASGPFELRDPVELLRHTPVVAGMDSGRVRQLALLSRFEDFGPGEAIIRAGDTDDRLFVMASGRAHIFTPNGIRELVPPDGFGEISVLHRVPRTANVEAVEPCRVLVVPGPSFRGIIGLGLERATGPT